MGINLLWLGAAGAGAPVVFVAQREKFFEKHGVDLELVPVTGTRVPEFSKKYPIGFIGAPAVLIRVADGADLKILASLDSARLSSCLVVRSDIDTMEKMRGKRLGARVSGAAMWIHTVLALEKLGLDPERDNIGIDEIGDPPDIVLALEAGKIDGAVLPRAYCEELAKGNYSILLDLLPLNVHGAPDALVADRAFVEENTEAVEAIVAGLIEAASFALSPRTRTAALEGIKAAMNISDDGAAEKGLDALALVIATKPYPSVETLKNMHRLMLTARPAVASVSIQDVVDDRFVKKLDHEGFIDHTLREYGLGY